MWTFLRSLHRHFLLLIYSLSFFLSSLFLPFLYLLFSLFWLSAPFMLNFFVPSLYHISSKSSPCLIHTPYSFTFCSHLYICVTPSTCPLYSLSDHLILFFYLLILARSPRRSTGDKSGLCNWILCMFVLGKFSNFFLQYKAAAVRAVISIRYGSKEGVQGSLLVPQYILP